MDKRKWVFTKTCTDEPELNRQDVFSTKELIEVMPFVKALVCQMGFISFNVTIGTTLYSVYIA